MTASVKEDCPFLLDEDEDYKPIETKTLSFRSNRSMWENIEKEKLQSKTLEQPKKKLVLAPDLLQDVLSVRSRSDSRISSATEDTGKDDSKLDS